MARTWLVIAASRCVSSTDQFLHALLCGAFLFARRSADPCDLAGRKIFFQKLLYRVFTVAILWTMKHSTPYFADSASLAGAGRDIAAPVIGGGISMISLCGLTGQTKGSVRKDGLNWHPEFMDAIGS